MRKTKTRRPVSEDKCEVWIVLKIDGALLTLTKKEALLVLTELEKLNLKSTRML